MTTIAIKDGVMACDSQVTTGDMRSDFKFEKIMLHDRCYYGFAGDCHNIALVKGYVRGEIDIEQIPDSVSLTVVALPEKGKPFEMTIRRGFMTAMDIPPNYAIGSGGDFAIVAMHCGKDAVEAVKVAKHFDIFTGGNVKSYSFNGKK